jgi:hypothetical protein
MRQHLHQGQGLKASYRWIIFSVTVFITSIGLMAWAAVLLFVAEIRELT